MNYNKQNTTNSTCNTTKKPWKRKNKGEMYIPRKEEKKDKEGEVPSKLDSLEGLNRCWRVKKKGFDGEEG